MKKFCNAASFALLFAFFCFPASANRIDLRLDGQTSGEYNSNLVQVNNFPGDFSNNYFGTLTLRYTAPTNTQILARVQGQYNKFIKEADFDVLAFAGSVTASQWLFNNLNLYAGVQPVKQFSLSTDRQPLDIVYLGGLTYYLPVGKTLGFAGYQFDRTNTQAEDFRSFNHTLLAGVRHTFTEHLFGNLSARARFRNLDISPDDNRFSSLLNFQYLLNEWLTLQASGEYTYVSSAAPDRTLGLFNFGFNLIAGYNNSFVF